MSRLPSEAASRNISACNAQAMSQVGCRLMVASSANTSRPRAPCACGDIARAFATKAAMSSEVEALASGSAPPLPARSADGTSPRLDLVGSPDIALTFGERPRRRGAQRSVRQMLRRFGFLTRGYIERHRSGVEGLLHVGLDRRDGTRLVGLGQELVQHALDRGLRLLRSGIAHVVVLEIGIDDGDAVLVALIRAWDHAGIGLELGILGTEGQDLKLAAGDEGHAQIVERHDLLDAVGI